MFRHAVRVHPEECCGILVGRRCGTECMVERIVEAANISEVGRARSYQICWRALLSTARATREGPSDILGFYHSHPDGSDRPSGHDLATAWIDYSYVILAVRDGCCLGATSWRVSGEGRPFEPETVCPA